MREAIENTTAKLRPGMSMNWSTMAEKLDLLPLWAVALLLVIAMMGAAYAAKRIRERRDRAGAERETEAHEGYIVSATLGLLALLLAFTFSLAVDRFDFRRQLVLSEAQAIGTAYYRIQRLEEPYRGQTTAILLRYLDNRIHLARLEPGKRQTELLAANDALLADLGDSAGAAFETIKTLDWSTAFMEGITQVSEFDLGRKIARSARVPGEIFVVLAFYMIAAAFVLGYVLKRGAGRFAAAALLGLFSIALLLIIDIDRPIGGGIVESQRPMEVLQQRLLALEARAGRAPDRGTQEAPR